MTAKMLVLRTVRNGADVRQIYRIKRNPRGRLVYELVRRVLVSLEDPVNEEPDLYARGNGCSHTRAAVFYDLARAAGMDPYQTPRGIVEDWWNEHLPLDTKVWRRLERKRLKAEAESEAAEQHNAGVMAECLLAAD